MNTPLWLQQAEMQALLQRIVDRLDKAQGKAMRPFKLDRKNFPELYAAEFEADKEANWSRLNELQTWGWLRIKTDRPKPGTADYDLNPRLEITDPVAIREAVGRLEPLKSAQLLWRETVFRKLPLSDDQLKIVANHKLEIPGKSSEEIVERLSILPGLIDTPLLLREVSARLFWGQSKILDRRQELVAAILGVAECPFPETPIQLQVFLPLGGFKGALFIENLTSFERATREQTSRFADLALIFASGFMSSAKRLRSPAGCAVYFAGHGSLAADSTKRFLAWLRGDIGQLPVWFWGDLDYAGMHILKTLRNSFPELEAWRPGYQPMLEALLAGKGHGPDAANKANQKAIATTGSLYADIRLIPAMQQKLQFLDQEFY